MEDDVEVVVLFEALGGVEFVRGEGDVARVGPALNLDEADVDGGFGVLGVGLAGDEIEPAVLSLDAFNDAALGLLVPDDELDRDALDFGV